MVGGSLHDMFEQKGDDGKPILGDDGKPKKNFSFAIAIPKTAESWQQEVWGAEVYGIGFAAFPALCNGRSFSWKITDGDSAEINKKGRAPNTREGYPGNWVVWFTSSFTIPLFDVNSHALTEKNSILPGYYIQVCFDCKGNGAKGSNTPGVYMNPKGVSLRQVAACIQTGESIDVSGMGFGNSPVPAEAALHAPAPFALPVAAVHIMTAAAGGAPYEAYAAQGWTDEQLISGGLMLPPPAPVAAVLATSPVAAVLAPPVAAVLAPPPNVAFLQVPAVPAVPAAPTGPVMTAAAGGAPYEAYIAQGWNDDMLRANGLMV
jgi:hypothetical protein